ncbi:MAG TPA: universal stress protein, partial [Kofleriaceae bacterium]|nr:universal stress protein [Kofleriaceae bacterium]
AAATLAAAFEAELVILHVVSVPALAYTSELVVAALPPEELLEAARKPLAAAAVEAQADGAPRVTTRLETGPVADVIADALADPSFDLCVLGATGRTGLARVLLGSIAEKVVRHAACSTLTVRPDAQFALPRHVLCPVDFSPSSAHAAEIAANLVRAGGAITLLHVLELPVRYNGELPDEDTARSFAPHAASHLDEWAALLRPRCTDIRIHSRVGNPGAQILGAIDRDHTVDLVCIGSHGRTGLRRMLLGSIAEKVVRHARCSVLVARARD